MALRPSESPIGIAWRMLSGVHVEHDDVRRQWLGVGFDRRERPSSCDVQDLCLAYTSGDAMRTNIVIDDDLMRRAMRASGARTKREAVETALRLMVGLKQQERLRRLRGKLKWEGDLDAMRRDS